ncbi:SpoIVB peptidase [Metallumcola ferriviriculae]|uniref:SpoIVB peptidase n=1 Tax=Metallumcola ferriviriculae TaxID=3039180 RepID=A0AAU0US62_9FIRM|nr:SpoIVB peptidase [Desulfitibacteraceae bacterium MK1]
MQNFRKSTFLGLCLIFLMTTVSFTSQVRSFLTLPTQQRIPVGEQVRLDLDFPNEIMEKLSLDVRTETDGVLKIDGSEMISEKVLGFSQTWPVAIQPGKVKLNLKLFGIIPLRQMTVNVVAQNKVYPGGQSIGVMLQAQGVSIVGYSPVKGHDDRNHFPAKEAGVEIGDQIISINGVQVATDKEAARVIDKAGDSKLPVEMILKRNDRKIEVSIAPEYCKETERYRIGLFIRDSAAGVGTLTFFEPNSKTYGALGHVIIDAETNKQIDLGHGKVVSAAVHGIQQGKKGQPGEKIGIFQEKGIRGNIEKNTTVGIFGEMSKIPENPYFDSPLPVALVNQIQPGSATVYTVVDGNKIERFSIEIERVMPYNRIEGKGMVIRINDPKLLSITGGIIQGMSGSPIVQNGKLVGAVTHVFINDPTRGYAVPAEWMLNETESITKTRTISKIDPGFLHISRNS